MRWNCLVFHIPSACIKHFYFTGAHLAQVWGRPISATWHFRGANTEHHRRFTQPGLCLPPTGLRLYISNVSLTRAMEDGGVSIPAGY